MNIRQALETHTPILAAYYDPDHVVISYTDLQELVLIAHDAVHPEMAEGAPEDALEQPVEDEAPLRSLALHYATQREIAQINAAHGLESQQSSTLIADAELILAFLKGGN